MSIRPGQLPAVTQAALADADVAAIPLRPFSGLDCKVLVLNKLFVAIRVISARRAFTMLCQNIAEVIHIDDGKFVTYDFESWAELSQLRREMEAKGQVTTAKMTGVDGKGIWIENEKHDWVRTVSFEMAVPRVIRLLGYDRLPAQVVKLNRRNLFARDRNICQYCGRHFSTSDLSIDHVRPRSQGGLDTWENLVCACIKCNARKGGRTPEEAHMHLVRPPIRPKRNPLIAIRLGQERYQSWKAFLDEAYWNVELK